MRVLIVSQYFHPENFRINEVVRTLVEKGVEVEVLTGKPNYPRGSFFFRLPGNGLSNRRPVRGQGLPRSHGG